MSASSSAARRAENWASVSPSLAAPVVVRRACPQDGGNRQVHQVVIEAQPGHRAGHDCVAVVAAIAGDDALLLRLSDEVVVVPDQLGLRLVGIGTRGAVKHLARLAWRHAHQPVREANQLLVRVACVAVVVSQCVRLAGDGIGDFGAPVADVDAIEPCKRVDQFAAVGVANANAGARVDHGLGCFSGGKVAGIGGGMQNGGAVKGGETGSVLGWVHGILPDD